MDPTMVAQSSGLEAWLAANGALIQVCLYGAQFVYWVAMTVFVGYAVVQYKRWVNFQMGVGKSGALRKSEQAGGAQALDAESPKAEAKGVSVDEFVE